MGVRAHLYLKKLFLEAFLAFSTLLVRPEFLIVDLFDVLNKPGVQPRDVHKCNTRECKHVEVVVQDFVAQAPADVEIE